MTLIQQLQRDLLASHCQGAAEAADRADKSIRQAHVDLALSLADASNALTNVAPFVTGLNTSRLTLAIGLLRNAQDILAEYFATEPPPAPLTLAQHIEAAKAQLKVGPAVPSGPAVRSPDSSGLPLDAQPPAEQPVEQSISPEPSADLSSSPVSEGNGSGEPLPLSAQ